MGVIGASGTGMEYTTSCGHPSFGRTAAVASVVFSDKADDHTGPETEHDASESFPSCYLFIVTTGLSHCEFFWKNIHGWHKRNCHNNGGNSELPFQNRLNCIDSDSEEMSEEDRDE